MRERVPTAPRFSAAVERLPDLLELLRSADAAPVADHVSIPLSAGVYLFSEADNTLYVGQSRRLRRRLRNDVNPQGSHFQATFAWLLAMDEAKRRELALPATRAARQADPDFSQLFGEARSRVARMDVRWIRRI